MRTSVKCSKMSSLLKIHWVLYIYIEEGEMPIYIQALGGTIFINRLLDLYKISFAGWAGPFLNCSSRATLVWLLQQSGVAENIYELAQTYL
jgi:hypothetical protein